MCIYFYLFIYVLVYLFIYLILELFKLCEVGSWSDNREIIESNEKKWTQYRNDNFINGSAWFRLFQLEAMQPHRGDLLPSARGAHEKVESAKKPAPQWRPTAACQNTTKFLCWRENRQCQKCGSSVPTATKRNSKKHPEYVVHSWVVKKRKTVWAAFGHPRSWHHSKTTHHMESKSIEYKSEHACFMWRYLQVKVHDIVFKSQYAETQITTSSNAAIA